MEYMEFIREYRRMCSTNVCENCPFNDDKNGEDVYCDDFIQQYPEEAEEILQKWIDEHPVQTNADKFKETFGIDAMTFSVGFKFIDWLTEPYKGVE